MRLSAGRKASGAAARTRMDAINALARMAPARPGGAMVLAGLLWATGRCSLTEVISATSRLHVPIWAGLGGLVVSGLMLHPDLHSLLTQAKIALVGLLTLNGLQAGLLGRRLAEATGPVGRGLTAWGGATALLSQVCWWGAVAIGFLNTNR